MKETSRKHLWKKHILYIWFDSEPSLESLAEDDWMLNFWLNSDVKAWEWKTRHNNKDEI